MQCLNVDPERAHVHTLATTSTRVFVEEENRNRINTAAASSAHGSELKSICIDTRTTAKKSIMLPQNMRHATSSAQQTDGGIGNGSPQRVSIHYLRAHAKSREAYGSLWKNMMPGHKQNMYGTLYAFVGLLANARQYREMLHIYRWYIEPTQTYPTAQRA